MKKYVITDNELVTFSIETDCELIEEIFNKYLTPYLVAIESNEKMMHHYVLLLSKLPDSCIQKTNFHNNIFLFDPNDSDLQKTIKRIILDIYSRLLENVAGIFLHASAIEYNNSVFVFTGERGSGKTYNMINFITNNGCKFLSNDKIFLYKKNQEYFVRGFPSAIGIRRNTILQNQHLQKKYQNFVNDSNFLAEDDCCEKVDVDVKDLCSLLNTEVTPVGKLNRIFVLGFGDKDDTEICIKKIADVQRCFQKFSVDSVYMEQEFIKSMIDVSKPNISDDFYQLPVYYYLQIKEKNDINYGKALVLESKK